MQRIMSAIGAGIVAVIIGFTSVVSSYAAPVAPMQVQVTSTIENAQYREKRHVKERRHDSRRGWERNDRRRPHYESRRDRQGHWNGHRGYREKRRGYRRGNDGWWYPLAAFGAGVVIGKSAN